MIFLVTVLCVVVKSSILESDSLHRTLWTVYRSNFTQPSGNTNCQSHKQHYEVPTNKSIDFLSKYQLWPDLMFNEDLEHGEFLYGFSSVMKAIWKNQNPENCSEAKYLIVSNNYNQGMGAELHVLTNNLAIALIMGRVLLMNEADEKFWRTNIPLCKKQKKPNLGCYYRPWSKCTRNDALDIQIHHANPNDVVLDPSHFKNKTTTPDWTKEEDTILDHAVGQFGETGAWSQVADKLPHKSSTQARERYFDELDPIFKEAKSHESKPYGAMQQRKRINFHFYDAVSESEGVRSVKLVNFMGIYVDEEMKIVRYKQEMTPDKGVMIHTLPEPNHVICTAAGAGTDRKVVPPQFNDLLSCSAIPKKFHHFWWKAIAIAFFMRPNDEILKLLEIHRNKELHEQEGHCVSVFLRGDDKVTTGEMKKVPWSRYAKAIEMLFDIEDIALGPRSNLASQLEKIVYIATDQSPHSYDEAMEWGQKTHQKYKFKFIRSELSMKLEHRESLELTYFSYILHAHEMLQCRAMVLTPMSNYCRILDELRSTVAGRANRYMADVNYETCPGTVPCVSINDHLDISDSEYSKYDETLW